MKWNATDVELYITAKEYVDTALVPLIPISFDDRMKQLSSMSEFLSILSTEIEKKFKGRILLIPTFHYVMDDEKKVEGLQIWERKLRQSEFSHIFFLTSDINWKKEESYLSSSLVWIPAINLESLPMEQAREVMKQQVEQIISVFINEWKKGD
ncbi:YpiF family protein [Peribacillus asahii]|uniref:YpiF family protein n=1 Tax=Peribacillus asahii TaxID=228899 RepID=UPI0037FBFB93